jgi:hypothetical protein
MDLTSVCLPVKRAKQQHGYLPEQKAANPNTYDYRHMLVTTYSTANLKASEFGNNVEGFQRAFALAAVATLASRGSAINKAFSSLY